MSPSKKPSLINQRNAHQVQTYHSKLLAQYHSHVLKGDLRSAARALRNIVGQQVSPNASIRRVKQEVDMRRRSR